MRVNDQQITFNILNTLKYPREMDDCLKIETLQIVDLEQHSCDKEESFEEDEVTTEETA